MIRYAQDKDADTIANIYNYYIKNTTITFEEQILGSDEILKRMQTIQDLDFPWLVFEFKGVVVGYAYASQWNLRSAYRNTAEVSVYLDHNNTARGYGTILYEKIFQLLTNKGIKIVIGGVTLPNPASEALHKKFGMKKVAHFEKVGFKQGRWLDVGYWQKDLTTE